MKKRHWLINITGCTGIILVFSPLVAAFGYAYLAPDIICAALWGFIVGITAAKESI